MNFSGCNLHLHLAELPPTPNLQQPTSFNEHSLSYWWFALSRRTQIAGGCYASPVSGAQLHLHQVR